MRVSRRMVYQKGREFTIFLIVGQYMMESGNKERSMDRAEWHLKMKIVMMVNGKMV